MAQGRSDPRAELLYLFINGGVGGIRLHDGLQVDPELRQKRESVDAPHTPLVVGHILPVDQVADLTGRLTEFGEREVHHADIASASRAGQIVLACLGRNVQGIGKLDKADLLRIVFEGSPKHREQSERILKYLSGHQRCQLRLVDFPPIVKCFGCLITAGNPSDEVTDTEDTDALPGLHFGIAGRKASEGLWQIRVVFRQRSTDLPVIFIRQPQTECGTEIMVSRIAVIEAEALGSLADETGCNAVLVQGVFFFNERFAVLFVIRSAKIQPF